MDPQPFDASPFAKFAREEDFNTRISEAIRASVTRSHARRSDPGEPERIIDFEDHTTIALGVPRKEDGAWIVEFEVGGEGLFYENPVDGLPCEDTSPCVCRGELRIEETGDRNSLIGPFDVEVLKNKIFFGETLNRP